MTTLRCTIPLSVCVGGVWFYFIVGGCGNTLMMLCASVGRFMAACESAAPLLLLLSLCDPETFPSGRLRLLRFTSA